MYLLTMIGKINNEMTEIAHLTKTLTFRQKM